MENPYTRYLDNEYDEIAILKEMQRLLVEGETEKALRLAMKAEAVKYVKQSLKKVYYEINAGGIKEDRR